MTAAIAHIFRAAAEQAALGSADKVRTDASRTNQHDKTKQGVVGTITLQELLQLHGDASTAVVLMLLALFSTLPVAGIGSLLSLAMFALAWRWVRQVETTSVHTRIGDIRLNPLWTGRTLRFLAWMYEQADRLLEPRMLAMSSRSARPWWAVWICLMAAIIFVPIPLGNILPSFSLVTLSLAWMFRDGIALLVSLAFGVAAMVFTAVFGQLAWEVLVRAGQWLMGVVGS